MFGKKENETQNTNSNSSSGMNSINTLSQGTKIEGSIFADSDIRIDGNLIGNLECTGRVIVGPSGNIDGIINCANAVIEGSFKGTITVKDQLHVKETATINGEVKTGKLIVQPGAIFNVTCQMGGQTLSGFKSDKKEAIAS